MKYLILILFSATFYLYGRINSFQGVLDCAEKVHEVETKERLYEFFGHKTLHYPHFHAYFYMRGMECLIKEKL